MNGDAVRVDLVEHLAQPVARVSGVHLQGCEWRGGVDAGVNGSGGALVETIASMLGVHL